MNQVNYLFVYGTLMKNFNNEFATYIRDRCNYIGKGYFNGLLFDLGEYPGAIYIAELKKKVFGNVFEVTSSFTELIQKLDEYEEVGEQFDYPNEYRRDKVTIHLEDQSLECWAYLYNRDVNFKNLIISGDYLGHQNNTLI